MAFPASAQRRQSVLWEVSGHGLAHKSYLFGTVHTLPPALLDRFPVKQYMSQAQFGVFEVSGSPISPAQPKKNSAPERPQPPLDSLFSKRDYAVVDSFFSASPLGSIKEHNGNADIFAMFYVAMRLKQNPVAEGIAFDESIAEEMKQMGKPIFRLDADDDPDIKAVTTSYAGLAKALVSLIKEKNFEGYFVPGDTKGAYVAHLTADLKLHEEATGLGRDLSVRRNLLWVPQLEQKMREGSCFVAVGFNHLSFKSGLIVLLRQQGYKVKPVPLASSAPNPAPGAASRSK